MGRPGRHSSSLPLPHDLTFGSSVEVSWPFLVVEVPSRAALSLRSPGATVEVVRLASFIFLVSL